MYLTQTKNTTDLSPYQTGAFWSNCSDKSKPYWENEGQFTRQVYEIYVVYGLPCGFENLPYVNIVVDCVELCCKFFSLTSIGKKWESNVVLQMLLKTTCGSHQIHKKINRGKQVLFFMTKSKSATKILCGFVLCIFLWISVDVLWKLSTPNPVWTYLNWGKVMTPLSLPPIMYDNHLKNAG